MATVRRRQKRSSGDVTTYWVVDYSVTRSGRTKRKQEHFRVDPRDPERARLLADRRCAEVDAALLSGRLNGGNATSLGPQDVQISSWLDAFCIAVEPNCSAKYHKGVVNTLQQFRDALADEGALTTAQLRRQHFSEHVLRMQKRGSSPKTVKNHLAIIKRTVQWGIDESWLDPALIRSFPSVKVPERKRRVLAHSEIEDLLSASNGTSLHEPVLIALYTGARRGELVQLQCSDIDLERGVLHFRGETTKTGANAQVPIHDRIRPMLERKARQEGYLVRLPGSGRWSPAELTRRFTALVRDELGWDDVTFHCLRHTFGTQLAASGRISPFELQRLMRHKHIQTSMIYVNMVNQELPDINVF